mmetsp:Transcript_21783/g.68237  ORF Transcript_21783/g.68237 Transcript_21783/m.68237 type:complete len:255 (+) Transcript_21783:319-1083(+)
MYAAFSVSSRTCSSSTRLHAIACSVAPCRARSCPKARRVLARAHSAARARSATPMLRMQWCMRPGPSRACAIAKPPPSSCSKLARDTRTLWKATSAWPWGASSYPNTLSMRTTSTPAVSIGTSTIDCCIRTDAPAASASPLGPPPPTTRPMTMASLQRGSPAPVVHTLRPLMTYSSPSRSMRVCTFVASEHALCGSVIAKHERISPRSSGCSHVCCCSRVPKCARSSMLPVSGAAQLNTSAHHSLQPISSARGA